MEETILDSLSMVYQGALADSVASVKEVLAGQQESITGNLLTSNNIWMMLATALVFIMHLGFAGVEAGFTQAKNTVNILFKNTMTVCIGLLTYALFGFALMYPGEFQLIAGGILGFAGWGLTLPDGGLSSGYADAGYTYWTDFLFQAMFAATCATIVSGAVAERIKISSYLIFTLFFVGLVYPIIGSWKWGAGFLDEYGFYDFAGSTLVHSVGGWGALVGIALLGPRVGKYASNGEKREFPNFSIPLATIGVFLLWLGWFGFNGGSVLSADPGLTSLVLTTTSLAAAAGAVGAVLVASLVYNRLDQGMALNGILAGLVGITAGADLMSWGESIIIGLISGGLVVLSVELLEKLKLDDCVGAVSVHLTCGIFGTLAVGIFGSMASWDQFVIQLVGLLTCGGMASLCAFIIFGGLKATSGIRVTEEHEVSGMDSHEHGVRGLTIVYDA
ncbi:MAG: ammonium transporter [Bacteroidota bacterium]